MESRLPDSNQNTSNDLVTKETESMIVVSLVANEQNSDAGDDNQGISKYSEWRLFFNRRDELEYPHVNKDFRMDEIPPP